MLCIHWVHYHPVKAVGLRISVQRDLRDEFIKACRLSVDSREIKLWLSQKLAQKQRRPKNIN